MSYSKEEPSSDQAQFDDTRYVTYKHFDWNPFAVMGLERLQWAYHLKANVVRMNRIRALIKDFGVEVDQPECWYKFMREDNGVIREYLFYLMGYGTVAWLATNQLHPVRGKSMGVSESVKLLRIVGTCIEGVPDPHWFTTLRSVEKVLLNLPGEPIVQVQVIEKKIRLMVSWLREWKSQKPAPDEVQYDFSLVVIIHVKQGLYITLTGG